MKDIEIISEIGINHMGNMNIAHKLIADAAECGATMAKFQWYSVKDLFGDPSKPTYRKDIYKTVLPFELDEEKIEQLIGWCEKYGIDFGCSIFDEERFLKLDAMGVKKHKLASRVSKFDPDLAHKVLKTGKSTYMSLGFDADPTPFVAYDNCKFLYCVASYPADHAEFDIPKSFEDSIYYGLSSHAMDVYPSMVALARGAKCIEVHFTLNKGMAALPGGFDHLCSLDKSELKQLCDFADKIKRIK
jgi:sialic acid synthase SpsE